MNRFLKFLKILLFFMVPVTSRYEKFNICVCEIINNTEDYDAFISYQELFCKAYQQFTTFNSSTLKEFQYIDNDGKVNDCMNISIDNQSSLDNVTSLVISTLPLLEIHWLNKFVFMKLKNIKHMQFEGIDFHENVSYFFNFFQNNKKLEYFLLQDNTNLTMPNKFFYNLINLKTVSLSGNNFKYLPDDLFLNNIDLKYLTLSQNSLTYLDGIIFKNCQNLEELDLSYNHIASLDKNNNNTNLAYKSETLFTYCKELVAIHLNNNKIKNLTKLHFKNLFELNTLDLSYNEIFHLDCDVFKNLLKLTHLYLNHNNLKHIWHCHVNYLVHLKIANFSHNNLTISYNREKWDKSPFRNSTYLQKLYLDNNKISKLWVDWRDKQMGQSTEINLSNNELTSLADITFSNKINSTIILDVSYNNITSLHYEKQAGISYDGSEKTYTHIEVHADNNPLNCDCSLYELIQHTNKAMRTIEHDNWKIHMDNLKCNEPSLLKNTPIETFESETYRCLPNESNVDYAKCPENCSCWRYPLNNSSTIIDCSSRNLTSGPNSIHRLFGEQIELNLSNNLLNNMPLSSQSGYESVTILDLSYNNITDLSLEGLPIKLKILYMHNNKLVKIEPNVLHYLRHNWSNFKELTLHDNPWECNCDLYDLRLDLDNKTWSQSEKEKITCGPSNRKVYKLSEQDLCPLNYPLIITICIVLAFVAITICIVIIIFYLYEERIKIWLYEKQWLLFWVTEEELDKDKYYDAFISYSHEDRNFVVNNLVRGLENGPQPFKLCVHERDWNPGEKIPIQITQSIDNSKRTIVILSSNFLKSDWANTEFQVAHRRSLEDRRNRVIVIIFGELPPIETFNEELQSYLKMYTYVEWGDPWFWPKLRFAMPHKNRNKLPKIDRVVTIDDQDGTIRETRL